jgi:hypothetical protein
MSLRINGRDHHESVTMEGKTSMIRISFAAAAIAAVAETRGKARGSTATLSFLAADWTLLQISTRRSDGFSPGNRSSTRRMS